MTFGRALTDSFHVSPWRESNPRTQRRKALALTRPPKYLFYNKKIPKHDIFRRSTKRNVSLCPLTGRRKAGVKAHTDRTRFGNATRIFSFQKQIKPSTDKNVTRYADQIAKIAEEVPNI
jgi:hypothetical protein